jgi:hypothetical protein
MPNDAKLGLVAGVALVIAVAVVYFQSDLAKGKTPSDAATATVVTPAVAPPRGPTRTANGKTMSNEAGDPASAFTAQMPKAEDGPITEQETHRP